MTRPKTGGRVKGTPNKATREIKQFALEFLTSAAYLQRARDRVMAGSAPHLETLWHHYAFGKPKETLQLDGIIPPFILRLDAE